jgi:hypothetical protein
MEKRQQHVLLQCFEWRRGSNMAYWSVSNGEETLIWPAAVFRIEQRQQYCVLQYYERRRDNEMIYCRVSIGEETRMWFTARVLATSATTDLIS